MYTGWNHDDNHQAFRSLEPGGGQRELAIAVEHSGRPAARSALGLPRSNRFWLVCCPPADFAINHAFVADDREIAEGDEVALIGLTSGG